MAKHRIELTRRKPATRLWVIAALVLGLGVSVGWADQQAPSGPKASARTAQTPGQKTAKSSRAKAARTAAQRPSKTTTSSDSQSAAGRRDPFKLPVYVASKGGGTEGILESGGVLPTGKRGLVIGHLVLQGVVRERTSNKMIAVVTNETKVARFLYENDSLYNGVVSKITPDAVYFKENVLDTNGRVTTREVVKRLGSAPGEGR